jgi:hypothetical protein
MLASLAFHSVPARCLVSRSVVVHIFWIRQGLSVGAALLSLVPLLTPTVVEIAPAQFGLAVTALALMGFTIAVTVLSCVGAPCLMVCNMCCECWKVEENSLSEYCEGCEPCQMSCAICGYAKPGRGQTKAEYEATSMEAFPPLLPVSLPVIYLHVCIVSVLSGCLK